MYHQRVNVAAFILAGGRSTRMGKDKDKAFLELAGRSLVRRAMDLAATVTTEIQIVGEPEKFLTIGPTVPDIFSGCGPLGGIHAALSQSNHDLNLVLAVDLPLVQPSFLAYLVAQASQTSALATVPRAAGGWQPLCAVYRRQFAELAERALKQKKNKIDALFFPADTREIGEAELQRTGFQARMFSNLNTPGDFEQAERELSGR